MDKDKVAATTTSRLEQALIVIRKEAKATILDFHMALERGSRRSILKTSRQLRELNQDIQFLSAIIRDKGRP